MANLTFENIGRGVRAAYDGKGKIVLELDVSPQAMKAAPLSSSGKTHVTVSTGGFKTVGPIAISLNSSHKGETPSRPA